MDINNLWIKAIDRDLDIMLMDVCLKNKLLSMDFPSIKCDANWEKLTRDKITYTFLRVYYTVEDVTFYSPEIIVKLYDKGAFVQKHELMVRYGNND